jgi:hypothetical protein
MWGESALIVKLPTEAQRWSPGRTEVDRRDEIVEAIADDGAKDVFRFWGVILQSVPSKEGWRGGRLFRLGCLGPTSNEPDENLAVASRGRIS